MYDTKIAIEYPRKQSHADVSLQPKRRDTGLTGIEGCNFTLSDSIESLNFQIDDTFSGHPEFKKSVSQSGYGLIDEKISILIHCGYIKRFFGQFPLTGGHEMRGSLVRSSYIGRHRHKHSFFRQRYLLLRSIGKFKDHLPRGDGALDIFLGPFPLVGDGYCFNGVDRFPVDVSWFFAVLNGIGLKWRKCCKNQNYANPPIFDKVSH